MPVSTPQTPRQRARRRRLATYIVIAGFLASSVAGLFAWKIERDRVESIQNFAGTTVANTLQSTLTTVESRLHSLRGIFALKRGVAPEEFEAFARELQPLPAVRNYRFIRQVRQDAAADYERRQSDLRDEPFRIVERDVEQGLMPAAERPFHYPVEFIFPQRGNEDVLGLDIASMPELFTALREAWESGEDTVGGLFRPGREGAPPLASMFLAFTGRFAEEGEALRGVLVAEIDVNALTGGSATTLARIVRIDNAETGVGFIELPSTLAAPDLLERNVIAGDVPWVVTIAVQQEGSPFAAGSLVFGLGALLTLLALGGVDLAKLQAENRLFGQRLADSERILGVREAAYQSLFYNAGTANMEIDLASRQIVRSNDRAAFMTGYTEHELAGKDLIDLFAPEDRAQVELALAGVEPGRVTAPQLECRVLTRDGGVIWVLANPGGATETESGAASACLVMQDITSRKESARARDILVRELAHRLRNTMQLVSSLADQTMQSVETPQEYRDRLQGRLRALNAAHDALFDTNWAPVRLDWLTRRVLAAFEPQDERERISVEVAPVMLPARQLQMIALALHELASNAVRHGALKSRDGHIDLKIEHIRSADGNGGEVLKLTWRERAPAANLQKPARRGFGSVMLEHLLERQYEGVTKMDWQNDGLCFEAVLPLRVGADGEARAVSRRDPGIS